MRPSGDPGAGRSPARCLSLRRLDAGSDDVVRGTGAACEGHRTFLSFGAGRPPRAPRRHASERITVPTTTQSAKPGSVERRWHVVDAEGQNLGRLASIIAEVLAGKRSAWYTRHCDTGDFVVVVNAERIAVTGNKLRDKRYWRHSGYPGGIRSRSLGEQLARRPEEVLRRAVRGMLPKNSLGRRQLTKLKIYAGPEHPHAAQQPAPLRLSRVAEVS